MNDWPKCGQENCTDDATARVFWPGRAPMYACAIHIIKAQHLGRLIGCYIHAEQLKPNDMLRGEQGKAL